MRTKKRSLEQAKAIMGTEKITLQLTKEQLEALHELLEDNFENYWEQNNPLREVADMVNEIAILGGAK